MSSRALQESRKAFATEPPLMAQPDAEPGPNRVFRHRLFNLSATGAFLCITAEALYLHSFPVVFSPLGSDLLLISLVVAAVLALLGCSLNVSSRYQVALVLLGIWLLSFLTRALPHIRLSLPFLHDSYFYAIGAQDILASGTLTPVLSWWYPQIGANLHWPIMPLITVDVARVTGIDPFWLIRFQEPFLGAFTGLAVFLVARLGTSRNDMSLIAALLASSSDLVVYYQSEYHPQGLVIVFLIFFLFTYLKSRTSAGLGPRLGSLVFVAVLVLVHHFSSILIAILAVGFVLLAPLLARDRSKPIGTLSRRQIAAQDSNLWLLVAVSIIAYNILVFFSPAAGFIRLLQETQPNSTVVTAGTGVPIPATILNGLKWAILLLAIYGFVCVRREIGPPLRRLAILLALLLVGGVTANFVIGGPTDRLIAFYAPLASIFAALGGRHLMKGKAQKKRGFSTIAATAVLVVIVAGGLLNVALPAYYFHTATENPYYWASDRLSSATVYEPTGKWLSKYTANGSVYVTEFDTWMVPFFFAGRPVDDVRYVKTDLGTPQDFLGEGFIVMNPTISYYYQGVLFNKTTYLDNSNVWYANGELVVCELPS